MSYLQDFPERTFFVTDKISTLIQNLVPDLEDGVKRYIRALETRWDQDHFDSLTDSLSQLSVRNLPSVHNPDRWKRCLHIFSTIIELSHLGVSEFEVDSVATRRFYASKSLKNSLHMPVSDLFAGIQTCVALITADNVLGVAIRKFMTMSSGTDAQAMMFGFQEVHELSGPSSRQTSD